MWQAQVEPPELHPEVSFRSPSRDPKIIRELTATHPDTRSTASSTLTNNSNFTTASSSLGLSSSWL